MIAPRPTPTDSPEHPAGHPRRLAGHRRTTRAITPVLTPLVAVGVAVLTAVSAGSAAGPPAGGRAPVRAAVGPVAFRAPAPAARAIHCPDRSDEHQRRHSAGDDSAIQIDILLGHTSAGGSTGRRGPLVVGCGPDGQVVVLACAATGRERAGDHRRGERRSDYGSDYRSDYGDVDQGDLDLDDLIDLSDALGVDLDSLVELAGMEITGRGGRIQLDRDRDRHRGDARSLSVWDRYGVQTDTDSPSGGSGLLARLARAASDRHAGRQPTRDSDDQPRRERAGVCR